MEENQNLHALSIDHAAKADLQQTAKWARILIIAGILSLMMVVAAGIYQVVYFEDVMDEPLPGQMEQGTIAVIFIYLCIIILAAVPIWYLFKFSSRMMQAIRHHDQHAFNESLRYLKVYFRFLGILTLIAMAIMVLGMVAGIVGMRAMT